MTRSVPVSFATSNKHKIEQARLCLDPSGIRIRWIRDRYDEASDDTIEQVAAKGAAFLAEKRGEPVIVEDTGLFFDAYPDFPGAMPKFVFERIGYDGLFRLLRSKPKGAIFRSCVGYCEPGKRPRVFSGEMHGRIILQIHCPHKDVLPYERVFVPKGKTLPMCKLSPEEKQDISHRMEAFRIFASWFSKKKIAPESFKW
ncbi:MAG: non-canonical purine NTP pyrophosphatase [archaeon]